MFIFRICMNEILTRCRIRSEYLSYVYEAKYGKHIQYERYTVIHERYTMPYKVSYTVPYIVRIKNRISVYGSYMFRITVRIRAFFHGSWPICRCLCSGSEQADKNGCWPLRTRPGLKTPPCWKSGWAAFENTTRRVFCLSLLWELHA